MIGVIVNFITVTLGGTIGTLLKGGIPEKYSSAIYQGIALCVLVIGVSGAVATEQILVVILSIVLGTALGELMRIEDGLEALGKFAQRKLAREDNRFAEGFVSATLLFSVGAMAVVGSLEAGISMNYTKLFAKSALDGVTAIIFASSMGPGVILSAVPLTVYQGGITLLSGFLSRFLSAEVINEMSATGSILIIGLSLNMLGVMKKTIRVSNMLPAMIFPVFLLPLINWLMSLLA